MVENLTGEAKNQLFTPTARRWLILGGVSAALSVGLGAFGAHGLEGYLERLGDAELMARRLDNWKTAAMYQMHHSIGLIVIGILLGFQSHAPNRWLSISAYAMLAGILIFSGCLYALVLTEVRVLGAIVPIGGVSMMVAWIALAIGAAKVKS